MKKNTIISQMKAAGATAEAINAYIEALDSMANLVAIEPDGATVIDRIVAHPQKTNGAPLVVMSDGTLGRMTDGDPVEHWTR